MGKSIAEVTPVRLSGHVMPLRCGPRRAHVDGDMMLVAAFSFKWTIVFVVAISGCAVLSFLGLQ